MSLPLKWICIGLTLFNFAKAIVFPMYFKNINEFILHESYRRVLNEAQSNYAYFKLCEKSIFFLKTISIKQN